MTVKRKAIAPLCFLTLAVFAFALPVLAYTPPPPSAGDMYNSINIGDIGSYGFKAGTSYMQRFKSNISTYPTELAIRMGSNQNLYGAQVIVQVNDVEVFRHSFYNLVQRPSDWATVFSIKQLNRVVNQGDFVTFIVSPSKDTGIAALQLNDANCPPQNLTGYGNINTRFYFRGNTQPDGSAYNEPVADPAIIRTSMVDSGSTWALGAGLSYTQSFTAVGGGVPTELGVVMGNNQNAYNVRVQIAVNGTAAYDQTHTGKVQRYSDWATVFPLTGFTRGITAGDTVAFTVTPNQEIGFSAILFDEVGMPKGTFPRYGSCRAQFYLKK
jgi:hypothetical protein